MSTSRAQTGGIIEPRTDDVELNTTIKKYLRYEKIEAHRQYVERLVQENDVNNLVRLFKKRLTFGTAGIRGPMGPGFSQMNDLVVIQTTQGMVSYLLELNPQATKEQGVIIGHDARHNSDRFSRLAALAFLQKDIPVYYCEHIIPTPLIAFGVRQFGCCSGIVITASHNPKEDNGFKVYGSNGAQILSPLDTGIQEHIMKEENQVPWPRAWNEELLRSNTSNQLPREWNDKFSLVQGDLSKNYFTYIESLVGTRRGINMASNISITYTSMHGVGHSFLSRALDIAGFTDVFPVELQKKPDPNFSTVRFPNPEETGALELAFETARHANSNLILAIDPDADRCAAALYNSVNNYRRVLTGNEIGMLLGWWIWHNYKLQLESRRLEMDMMGSQGSSADQGPMDVEEDDKENPCAGIIKPQVKKVSDVYMISTAVSSKFLESMARKEGFRFVETLTGFKYMGNVADELMRNHNRPTLFAYEEAIGYMVDSTILDKDGISAAIMLAQLAAFLVVSFNRNLVQHLDHLYLKYGFHYNINSYYICPHPQIIDQIFRELQANYPVSFGDNEVRRIRDLNKGYDTGAMDERPILPCSTNSHMITFFIDDDVVFTVRTSGTEPKIKYYSEIVARLPPSMNIVEAIDTNNFNDERQQASRAVIEDRLRQVVQLAVERCIKPRHYDLEPAE